MYEIAPRCNREIAENVLWYLVILWYLDLMLILFVPQRVVSRMTEDQQSLNICYNEFESFL